MPESSFSPRISPITRQSGDALALNPSTPTSTGGALQSPFRLRAEVFSQLWKEALLPYLGTRFVLVIIGLLATYYLMPLLKNAATYSAITVFPQSLWLMWQRFDSGFYISIAQHGYWPASTLHSPTNWVFYPLYPLLIAGLGNLFGASNTAFIIAGVLISFLAGLVAVSYLYLLVRKDFSREIATRSVLYLALFPMSFYLSAIYTEALFLALALACIYYARQQTWWLAGICGGLAALSRSQGVLLLIPVAWEYLRVLVQRYISLPAQMPKNPLNRLDVLVASFFRSFLLAACELRNWLAGLSLALIPAGLLAFMIYAKIETGDFLATFHANAWGWMRQLTPPWQTIQVTLLHPILAQPMDWNFWILNVVATFAFLGFVIWAFRRLPMIYALYTAVMVLLPLSSNIINSIGRYYLVVFPAFILLALPNRAGRQPWHNFIIASFAALQAILMAFFVIVMPAIA